MTEVAPTHSSTENNLYLVAWNGPPTILGGAVSMVAEFRTVVRNMLPRN